MLVAASLLPVQETPSLIGHCTCRTPCRSVSAMRVLLRNRNCVHLRGRYPDYGAHPERTL